MSKTYHQIQQEIERLQREAERLRQEEVAGVIARIKEAIQVYGLTAADLGLGGAGLRKQHAGNGTSATRVKYRDEAGNTWSGRGPRPQWLRDALAAGRSLDEFAVQRAAGKAARRAAGRNASKAAKPALRSRGVKYRDENGNSWTGMGPKPRWLKEAVAAGKTLEDFAA
ncbi:H-NS family nucleoid-associated regulatory protein [Methylibium rhizosphaerae]|uniref:H-NS family nucleoid-associated regulatory protein n=1 Tax=Methylibium rhizosphaerae TaxID=2570323 RepID=UPI00319E7622